MDYATFRRAVIPPLALISDMRLQHSQLSVLVILDLPTGYASSPHHALVRMSVRCGQRTHISRANTMQQETPSVALLTRASSHLIRHARLIASVLVRLASRRVTLITDVSGNLCVYCLKDSVCSHYRARLLRIVIFQMSNWLLCLSKKHQELESYLLTADIATWPILSTTMS